MGEVIVVASGKGGVGKSTITASLSYALALRGYSVLAVDADVGLRNLDILLGLEDRSLFNLADVLTDKCKLSKAIIPHDDVKKLFFLPSPQLALPDDINPAAMKNLFSELADEYDFVFVDCPAGIGRGFMNAIAGADRALVVATPDNTSIRDADRAAGILIDSGITDTRLIINRVRPDLIKKRLVANIDEMIDRISLQLVGLIPEDENVLIMTNSGKPVIYGKGPAAKALNNIASRMEGMNIPLYRFWK